jgi:pimeloyl-ACP methyl ester carboxylesterase
VLLAIAALAAAGLAAPARAPGAQRPTIVLVHGAFVDASGFANVTARLQARGYKVLAPPDPLRGPATDAAYVADVLKTIKGPIVLVGHSYGGAVISEAAAQVSNVKALVFLNALMLDQGESASDITNRFTNSLLGSALVARPYPKPDGTEGTDLYVDPAKFRRVFAADVPRPLVRVAATAQRPIAMESFGEKMTAAGWKTIPSWALVGGRDRALDPAAERFMTRRAHAHTIVIPTSSHASYLSHPAAVTRLILRAVAATR